MKKYAIDLCEEIENTLNPLLLRRWLAFHTRTRASNSWFRGANISDADANLSKLTLVRFFNCTAWLSPQIPDHADIGAYSQSVTASVYKIAAQNMPRLILMAAFGQEEVKTNMQYFMEQLERAEHTLSKADVAMLDNISSKDRGPFLYWLLNERAMLPTKRLTFASGATT